MQPSHEDAILDEVILACGNALIIIYMGAQTSGHGAIINNVQSLHTETLAQLHELLQARVLVDKIRLTQVPKCLMGENPGHGLVGDHGIFTTLYSGR